MTYRLKDVIRKDNREPIIKPDDIGTKPISKWKREFNNLFSGTVNVVRRRL